MKQHAGLSFKTAVAAGVLGFLLIACGLFFGFMSGGKGYLSGSNALGYMATASGLITEFIAGIFFVLYSKTVRQLKSYHDSLLEVQRVLLSLKLLESVADEQLRAPMITTMLECLMSGSIRPDAAMDKEK